MPTIYDFTLASQTLIEDYRSKGYDDYLIAVALANAEIERAILKTKGTWTKAKLNALKKLIEEELLRAYGGLFESIQSESVDIAKINFEAITGLVGISATFPKSAVQDLVNSRRAVQMGFNDKTKEVREYEFKKLFDGTQESNINTLKTILAGSVASGKTPQQIARDVTFKSDKLSKGQMRGNVFSVIVDSKNQGVYESYREIEKTGLDLYYEHVSVMDSNVSEICRNLDGRKYYVPFDEIPSGFKPVLHANCRSQLIMRVSDFKDVENIRSTAFGAIPDEPFKTWFNKQSSQFQKDTLGQKKYKLFKEGKYTIQNLPDVVGSTSNTLDQYKTKLIRFTE